MAKIKANIKYKCVKPDAVHKQYIECRNIYSISECEVSEH